MPYSIGGCSGQGIWSGAICARPSRIPPVDKGRDRALPPIRVMTFFPLPCYKYRLTRTGAGAPDEDNMKSKRTVVFAAIMAIILKSELSDETLGQDMVVVER